MRAPKFSKTWLLALIAFAVEETVACIFTRGIRISILLTIPFLEGLWLALPVLWADQLREVGVSPDELLISVVLGGPAIWVSSYVLGHMDNGQQMVEISGVCALVLPALYFSAQIFPEKLLPRLKRFPSLAVVTAVMGWCAFVIAQDSDSLVIKICMLAFIAFIWSSFPIRLLRAPKAETQANIAVQGTSK